MAVGASAAVAVTSNGDADTSEKRQGHIKENRIATTTLPVG